ncbi:hypothetical protein GmarT_53610 [Gimesia maris]|uniref:Uncharacterized protein n=1 Tax=Gimesia maris TaxID=122 RepID=A0ABX5YUU9_9PLAN|nr:hypothetical protein Mal35_51620 [Gimesia maris]QDU17398.1 hypothetical protein CA11_52400 [Gimesia maris]QEG19461.1 hypothetical protein GmarT_53610 [Gimesia maris]
MSPLADGISIVGQCFQNASTMIHSVTRSFRGGPDDPADATAKLDTGYTCKGNLTWRHCISPKTTFAL